ncbi:hypothetical protein IAR55_003809 [Kwoniella newhampshirensis]|uniref:Palmitoyltransferase n=1 Tax=Kwoniella newhampshirensis TaxID=1651941 RepID=A0AAW0YXX4_9TREE
MLVKRLFWLIQQLIPPLLLSYFYAAWKICRYEVGPLLVKQYNLPTIARIYTPLPTILIGTITIHYLRLYFLPSTQSVPPHDPALAIRSQLKIFECLAPSEAGTICRANNEPVDGMEDVPLVDRCWKGRCGGRWKPARTRHCSQCGVCRGGFDHHCPFFANCLTAAYIPTFLSLLLYTPPSVVLLSLPLYSPMYHRALAAYTLSHTSENIRTYWWDWTPSWIIAGGPVGRFVGGLILGWRELDRSEDDGGGVMRLGVGLMVGFGLILALVTAGLATSSISLLLNGNLTIDQGRHSAHSRTIASIQKLVKQNRSIPQKLEDDLLKFSDRAYFFVPFENHSSYGPEGQSEGTSREEVVDDHGDIPEVLRGDNESGNDGGVVRRGVIVPALPEERPYDLGRTRNWEIVMGPRWSWLLPWKALSPVLREDIFDWPISESVEKRLRGEAERRRRVLFGVEG